MTITVAASTPNIASAAIHGRRNILISGGTGTGKMTLLNALATLCPDDDRIVVIDHGRLVQRGSPADVARALGYVHAQERFFEMAEGTELNALMLDLTDESGLVWYDSEHPVAAEVDAIRSVYDLSEVADRAESEDLYLIGRLVVFNDPTAAVRKPEMAVWDSATNQPYQSNNQYFLDPTDPEARAYGLGLAEEVCGMGVDEVQFDYVRFPDQRSETTTFDGGVSLETRTSTIIGFLQEGKAEKSASQLKRMMTFRIEVIRVPLAAPQNAEVVNMPRIFADPQTGDVAGLWEGGAHGAGTQRTAQTNACHDITVYPEIGLAGGACEGYGLLLDISDPVNPVRMDAVADSNFAYWHSATFNNDGTKVLFTDEWGGGGQPKCRATDPYEWGANAIFTLQDGEMVFQSYYKLPAPQTVQENCVAHNGSLIPIPGRDVMVQAWYQGGISVFDWTDAANPVEIAFFDRGPVEPDQMGDGGTWSAYWYNGVIVSSEIARGLDIFELQPSARLAWHAAPGHTLWTAVSRAVRSPSRLDSTAPSACNPETRDVNFSLRWSSTSGSPSTGQPPTTASWSTLATGWGSGGSSRRARRRGAGSGAPSAAPARSRA